MGTFVVSGTAIALVLYTGIKTELGKISENLEHAKTETEFEKGVKKFGYFLIEITLMLVKASKKVKLITYYYQWECYSINRCLKKMCIVSFGD